MDSQGSFEQREKEPRRFQFGLRTLFAVTTLLAVVLGLIQVFGLTVVVPFVYVVTVLIACRRNAARAIVLLAFGLFLFDIFFPLPLDRGPGRRASCMNSMKNITLALLDYEAEHGCFPPAYVADENGKPMHSWRVLILPYLERNN